MTSIVDKSKNILIISSADKPEDIETNEQFVHALKTKLGEQINLEWVNYHAIAIEFSSEGTKIYLKDSQKEIASYDFVYFKSIFRHSEMASIIARYLTRQNVEFVCKELLEHSPSTKLSQLDRMGTGNLSIPRTVYMTHREWSSSFEKLTLMFGERFIFKAIDAFGGGQNYLVEDKQTFIEALKENPSVEFTAQEFLENDSDYRVLILEGVPKLIIRRKRHDETTHLNNTSQGAGATLVAIEDFDNEALSMALDAAALLRRDIAGVDVLFELHTGMPYLLEVNASPQVGSGAFVEEKLTIFASYFLEKVGLSRRKDDVV